MCGGVIYNNIYKYIIIYIHIYIYTGVHPLPALGILQPFGQTGARNGSLNITRLISGVDDFEYRDSCTALTDEVDMTEQKGP